MVLISIIGTCAERLYLQSLSSNHEGCSRCRASSSATIKRPWHILGSKLCLFFRNTINLIRPLEGERCVSKLDKECRVLISSSLGFGTCTVNFSNLNLPYTSILHVSAAVERSRKQVEKAKLMLSQPTLWMHRIAYMSGVTISTHYQHHQWVEIRGQI
jgi:hypothetical protein